MSFKTDFKVCSCEFDLILCCVDQNVCKDRHRVSFFHYALEELKLSKKELPRRYTLSEELHCISTQPAIFYKMPDQMGLLPGVKGKICQSLIKKGQRPGTLIIIEYEKPIASDLMGYLRGLFWGSEEGPTKIHPEEMCVSGPFLLILSFEQGSPAAKWLKQRFRSKFNIRLASISGEHRAVLAKAYEAFYADDMEKALAILSKNK